MRKHIISFRFSDDELKALEALKSTEDKSPSQTASRLIRGIIGITDPLNTSMDLRELIAREVASNIKKEIKDWVEEELRKLKDS